MINFERPVEANIEVLQNCLDVCNEYYFAKDLLNKNKIPYVYWVGSLEEDMVNLSEALKNYQKPSLIRLHLKKKADSMRLLNMLYGLALSLSIPLLVYTDDPKYIQAITKIQKQF